MMSFQGMEDPSERASRFFPRPSLNESASQPFEYADVDWTALHLDPLLTLQLKIWSNPTTTEPPSSLSPALMNKDSQREIFLGFVERIL